MKRALALGLGLAVLWLAWIVRSTPGAVDARSTDGVHAGLARSDSDYRARLVELSLVGDRAPRRDAMLSAGAAEVPVPPLVHATWALAAEVALERDARAPELAGIDEHELERWLARCGPLAGLLAALLVAWAAGSLVEGPRRRAAASVALALYAFCPLVAARESAGTLFAQSFVAALLALELLAFGVLLRARENVDVALGALGCGVTAALAQLAGAEAWPVSLGVLGALVALALRAPRTKKREQWRAIPLYLASALAVYVLAEPGSASERWLPEFGASSMPLAGASPMTVATCVLLTALGGASAYRARRGALGATLLAALFASSVCLVFDVRFAASWSVCATAACALALAQSPTAMTRVVLAAAAATFTASVVLLLARREPSVALEGALRWLREHSNSSGPFNHPEAAHDWRVLCAPELAGAVMHHARRPVFAARIDGRAVGDVERARAALRSSDLDALAVEMARMDCTYVVLTARMLADPTLRAPASGALEQLVLAAQDDLPPHFQRVFASARREASDGRPDDVCPPAVAIFRRASGAVPVSGSDGPSISPADAGRDGARR